MKHNLLAGVIAILIFGALVALLPKSTPPAPAPAHPAAKTYVALGDSVAAGAGLEGKVSVKVCGRSGNAFPVRLAASLGYELYSYACDGATIMAGVLEPQSYKRPVPPPQLEQLFAVNPAPGLISLTIGANDTHWMAIAVQCPKQHCGTPEQTLSVDRRSSDFDKNLVHVLEAIKEHYGPHVPRTVVTDYYQIFAEGGSTCAEAAGTDATERQWVRMMQGSVNAHIEAIARRYSFVTFVHMNFDGHELCTPDSWVQGVTDPVPFHPNAKGDEMIARQIEDALRASRAHL